MLKKIWEFEKEYAYLFSVLPIAAIPNAMPHSVCKKLGVSNIICTILFALAVIALLHQIFCLFLYLYQVLQE